jgi:sulfatase maturation enzyme AslB (radical SAM superfamily)
MPWETLRAALDLALGGLHDDVELIFYGGEPLLELPLMQRAVAHTRDASSAGRLRFTLMTNGTLVDQKISGFLADHWFEVQLGFDGIPLAQHLRGKGTFAVLDGLLDRLRVEHPVWFSQKLAVSITLSSQMIPYLADSFDYFLEKGVPEIGIGPLFTHDTGWRTEHISALDEQFARIFRSSKHHYLRTGEVPLADFRKISSGSPHRPRVRSMCGAPAGQNLTVDVDGQVYGCVSFANSFQKFPGELLRDRLDAIGLGWLEDPELGQRLEAYTEAARATGLFTEKQEKYSSYGRCDDCRYLSGCTVCPVSIGHIPGNMDVKRVSDLQCAYNLVSLKYRDRFPRQTHPDDVLTGNAFIPEHMLELGRFAAFLKSRNRRERNL